MQIFLSFNCFVTLVSSAAEGVPNEVLGLLFGDCFNDDEGTVVVHQAIPLQIVERTRNTAECKPKYLKRVRSLWDNLTPYWPVGDFHSHPYDQNEVLDPSPSKTDKDDLNKGEIGITVSIKKTSTRRPLRYDSTGFRISGSASFFRIEMAAWNCTRKGRLEEVQIRCPFIDIISLGYKLGLAERPEVLFSTDTIVSMENTRRLRELISKYDKQSFKSNDSGAAETKSKIRVLLKRISRENT